MTSWPLSLPKLKTVAPIAVLILAVCVIPSSAIAQGMQPTVEPITPLDGTLERITVHGTALEGNLAGDAPNRSVSVYLPPSYVSSPERRYPVVYLLHGFTDSDLRWMGWEEHFVNVPAAMERAMGSGAVREMILVMPNAFTAYQGSMYSSSVTTGDWETYVAEELVAYIDRNYRTIPERASRGLAGHSMGGYGTLRIGMKRPDVFSSLYAMSPCCMQANLEPDSTAFEQAAQIESLEQVAEAGFFTKALLASAAAWSPDPTNPPLYIDMPIADGDIQQDVVAEWAANATLALVHQYVPELRRLTAIAMDAGAQDQPIAGSTETLSQILTEYSIDHMAEIYDPGNHINRVDERVEGFVLPFFSEHLALPSSPD